MIKSFLAIALTALMTCQTFSANKPMNVLMIAVDDLNDWVGFLGGHPQAKTPNMDRLAAMGMVFENAQCSGAASNPSRSALMSGIPPYESGLFSNQNKMRENLVLKDAVMIPRYFSNHGYTSLVRGKIFHHAGMDPQSWDIMSDQKKDKLKIPKELTTDYQNALWTAQWLTDTARKETPSVPKN